MLIFNKKVQEFNNFNRISAVLIKRVIKGVFNLYQCNVQEYSLLWVLRHVVHEMADVLYQGHCVPCSFTYFLNEIVFLWLRLVVGEIAFAPVIVIWHQVKFNPFKRA